MEKPEAYRRSPRMEKALATKRGTGRGAHTPERLQEFADAKGGHFMGEGSAKGKTAWACREGHEWEARTNFVLDLGTWCPVCAIEKRKATRLRGCPDEAATIAAGHGGTYRDGEVPSTKQKLSWECSARHRFTLSLANARKGTWCPVCAAVRAMEAAALRHGIDLEACQEARVAALEREVAELRGRLAEMAATRG